MWGEQKARQMLHDAGFTQLFRLLPPARPGWWFRGIRDYGSQTLLFLFGELSGVASTTAYTVDELGAAMQEAGFVDVVMQPFLPDLTFLVSGRKP